MKNLITIIPCFIVSMAWGQEYSMQQLVDSALVNNKLMQIKTYQIKEKQAVVSATNQLRLPNLTLGGSYNYNFTPLRITMQTGALGSTTLPGAPMPMPYQDIDQVVGSKNSVVAGAMLYQPILEQFKIHNGVNVKKMDVRIIEVEQQQAANKIKHGIQQLYLGININRYALEAIDGKIELAQEEVDYIQTAIESEKAIPMNYYGLKATLADERQQRLKKEAELLNMLNKLNHLTHLNLTLEQIAEETTEITSEKALQDYVVKAQNSPEYQIAYLNQQKANEGIKASKNSYLPDLGIVGGYAYQYGIEYINSNFAIVGVNLKWSINNIFKNKQEQNEREALHAQAKLFAEYTKEEIEQNITSAYNELLVAKQLVAVAEEVMIYRENNYKLHQDRYDAGLINKKDLVKTKQEFTKARSDFYASQLNYQIQLSRLNELTGN